LLRKTTSDTPTITSIINTEFETNFHWRTIYYQLNKLKDEEYGKLSQDALNLIKMLENDARSRNDFYAFNTNEFNEITKVCYMTERMQRMSNSFNDVIIIGGSLKCNRFNMHLLDVVVINNLGKTSTCFFSL